jgi:cysteine desulfurase
MGLKVYLDNHTTTRPFKEAVDKMVACYRTQWGSLASPHQMGQDLYEETTLSLKKIYASLGALETDSFFLTSGLAENSTQIFFSHYLESVRETGQNHFLISALEEAPSILSLNRLEGLGCFGKMLAVNSSGHIEADTLKQAIGPKTSLVSLSWASGLTGVIQPLHDLMAVCQEKGVSLHVDVSAALGKLFFRFQDLTCDFISFDGEKIHAPKGIGGIFVKEKIPFYPLISGAPHHNTPALFSLKVTIEKLEEQFDLIGIETARLRDKLEKTVQEALPETVIFFKDVERLPHVTALGFPGAHHEALLFLLHRKGVYASMGGGFSQKLSHLLKACGIPEPLASCALSFSLSHETTEADIDYAAGVIISSVRQLRACGEKL